ncbi:hypothetical protein Dsin_008397 [Dipteronia sinensis]|uniref:Uncharacterized protein n=1 Tax=Dipteronia sinensis TaxID=43782 RepID=A0AAE0ANX4_9ROSI|nr:hypothetical protein Dsin_008397 [Dipteronia sinensis]
MNRDLPLIGSPFTWSNNRDVESWARLDRFLISPEFLAWFPLLCQKGLSRSLSDHNAILLGEKLVDWGPTPFCFANVWLEEKEMMKVAVEGWKGCKVGGSKSVSLATKIKATKGSMKKWLRVNKRDYSRVKDIETGFAAVDNIASKDG